MNYTNTVRLKISWISATGKFYIDFFNKISYFVEQEKIDTEAGVKMPDWFIDAFFENATVNDLNSIIKKLPEVVSELMCHPGRAGEREVLTYPEVRQNLDKCHVRLAGFYSIK